MKDIRGFELPEKPVVRFGADGYRVKVWYCNGSGFMWMWAFYFTDPKPTLDEALDEANRIALEAAEERKRRKEADRLMMQAMAKSSMEMLRKRFPHPSEPVSDEIVITSVPRPQPNGSACLSAQSSAIGLAVRRGRWLGWCGWRSLLEWRK